MRDRAFPHPVGRAHTFRLGPFPQLHTRPYSAYSEILPVQKYPLIKHSHDSPSGRGRLVGQWPSVVLQVDPVAGSGADGPPEGDSPDGGSGTEETSRSASSPSCWMSWPSLPRGKHS